MNQTLLFVTILLLVVPMCGHAEPPAQPHDGKRLAGDQPQDVNVELG